MAFLFQKFQEGVKVLAKSTTFAKDPRSLQFEADINRLFLYTSYNRLGKDADEADAEEIIDMASKASLADQQKLVQENIHSQFRNFCTFMDKILGPEIRGGNELIESPVLKRSGLSLAVGRTSGSLSNRPAVPETKPLQLNEVSLSLKEHLGYSLEVRASSIPHEDVGLGLFLEGEADVGSVIAIYPGVIYSPAHYPYIPGYPRIDGNNPYLVTRYDGTIINSQPWGMGGDNREFWDGKTNAQVKITIPETSSDRLWKMLNKPLESPRGVSGADVLERRNPLAFAHFTNHPAKDMVPNVMICPYDFPLSEKDMRTYIPNIAFGNEDGANMKRFGRFWFKSWRSVRDGSDFPVLKTLVLVATRALCNEEILLNYRLSNAKRRPAWYTSVDEEEDRRRWG